MTSMKTFLGLVVIASAIGCGIDPAEPAEQTGETTQAVRACDDPLTCLRSNGGGVYTQEMGHAGLGSNDFMLTNIINHGGVGVSVVGVYLDEAAQQYVEANAEIVHAHLDAAVGVLQPGDYWITSVSEILTVPTITLSNGTQSGPVTGLGLLDLSIELKLPGGYATVSFAGHTTDKLVTSGTPPQQVLLQRFDMQWNSGLTVDLANRQSYCTLANVDPNSTALGDPDPVVFQQGIIVDPLSAVTSANNAYVTLSCRHGGIATARGWGYVYRGTQSQLEMFETAIHMKRASYCGDGTFYTRRDTDILINDQPTNINDDAGITSTGFEAIWGKVPSTGKIRALCVNMPNRRRRGAPWPPLRWDPNGQDFNGTCLDGTQIPMNGCPLAPLNPNITQWIVDQKAN